MSEAVDAAEAVAEETSVEETSQEAPAAEEQAVVEAKLIRSLSLKVDGEEWDEELPFDIPEEHAEYITQQLQLAKVAQKRMQESAESKKSATQMESEIKEFLVALKENPEAILNDPNLGIDLKGLAESIMSKELEEAAKPEEQKQREALENKLKELEDAKKQLELKDQQRDKSQKMQELRAEEDRIANQMQNEITEAIQENQLPNDPEMLKLVATNLRAALKYNVNVSIKELVPIIKRELYEKAKKQLAALQDDELADFIGSDRLNTIRKSMIKKLKSEVPSASQIKDQGKSDAAENVFKKKGKNSLKQRDFFKNPLAHIDK